MFLTGINALIYTIWGVIYRKSHSSFDMYQLLALLYAATAIMCFLYKIEEPELYHNISFFPFLYLFVAILLFLYPVKKLDLNWATISIQDNRFLKYLSYIFIGFSFYAIYASLTHTTELIQAAAWNELKNQTYVDADSVQIYNSAIQRLALNISAYLSPFGLVYAFYLLTKDRFNKLLVFSLFVSIIGPSFMMAIADASRGMIVKLAIKLLVGYLLFKNSIPQNRKRLIKIGFIGVLIGFLSFTIAVTISRFGNDEAGSSVFMYFGHSMLAFNDGLFYNMQDYAWGKKFFDWFIDLFGGNSYFDTAKAGCTCAGAFVTFVGSLFIDFGPFLTIFLPFITLKVVGPFFAKKSLALSDCIIIVFYVTTMANGIFVSPKGRALAWVMTFVIYYIVRIIETKKRLKN